MSRRIENEVQFPKGSEWMYVFNKEVKKVDVELTLTREYVNSRGLFDVLRQALVDGDMVDLFNTLTNLCYVERDIETLKVVSKLFREQVFFEINDNGSIKLFNEEE